MELLWDGYIEPLVWIVAKILAIVVPLLVAVAYLTYAERKVIGAIQLRKGPVSYTHLTLPTNREV